MKKKILNLYFYVLGFLARIYLKRTKPEVIGITGTIGKTSVRMIVYQILKKHLPEKVIYTSSKNFNGELGMVFSIFEIPDYSPTVGGLFKVLSIILFKAFFAKKSYDIVLLEYGIDHVGEMDFLVSVVKSNVGIFTKVDKVHAMNFGSPDIIAQEKFKMIENTKEIIFLNTDDTYCQSYTDDRNIDKFYFATRQGEADVAFDNYNLLYENGLIYTSFDLMLKSKKMISIKSNLVGQENAGYVSVGLTLLDIYHYKFYRKSFFEVQKDTLDLNLVLQSGRFGIFKGIKNSIIFDSSYNGSPLSIRKMIENVNSIKNQILPEYKIILVIGDMRELGEYTEKEHREIAGFMSGAGDYLYLVGACMSKYTADELLKIGFDKNKLIVSEKSKSIGEKLKKFVENSNEKYLILFKGSQNTIFLEEAVKYVLADKTDEARLPRQTKYWLKKKEKFFG